MLRIFCLLALDGDVNPLPAEHLLLGNRDFSVLPTQPPRLQALPMPHLFYTPLLEPTALSFVHEKRGCLSSH